MEKSNLQQQYHVVDLPPSENYYSANDYFIKVACSGNADRLQSSALPSELEDKTTFDMQIQVAIHHYLPSDPKAPRPYSYKTCQTFSPQSDQLRRPEMANYFLELMHIPFSLENQEVEWSAIYYLGGSKNNILTNRSELESHLDLVGELMKFFSFGKGLSDVSLEIVKWIPLPMNELEALESRERNDRSEYIKDVFERPMHKMRTCMLVNEQIMKLILGRKERGGIDPHSSCLICSKEFGEYEEDDLQTELVRLPCSHEYHATCIMERLKEELRLCCPHCSEALCIPNLDWYQNVYNDFSIRLEEYVE